uniref:Uncharacterized protein n=1 Tax=Oryza glaberrima TaxID=4538 RepID=I1QW50_ORYGL
MTKHGSSSFGGALSLCKVILMVLALICTLHTASVQGGSSRVSRAIARAPSLPSPLSTTRESGGGNWWGWEGFGIGSNLHAADDPRRVLHRRPGMPRTLQMPSWSRLAMTMTHTPSLCYIKCYCMIEDHIDLDLII